MNTSEEGYVFKNLSLFPKGVKLTLLAIGIFIPVVFLSIGAGVGAKMVNSTNNVGNYQASSHNSVAKGAKAPVISDIGINEITNSTAAVRWNTNKAADAQVDYGTSEVYEFASDLKARQDTKHEIFLTNLEPGTTYHFRVRSKDPVGNLSFSQDSTFETLLGKRGQVSICGWDSDSIERVDTFCTAKDGWAKGESWTESCTDVWGETASVPVDECIYQFSDVNAMGSIKANETWEVALEPNYTGWVDVLIVESPSGTDKFLPAAEYAEVGQVTMDALGLDGKYTFRFRPADDSAAWSDLLTVTVRR